MQCCHGIEYDQGYARYGTVPDLPAASGKKLGSSRGTVWEKVPVCLSRDGTGTGRWEAVWLTGRDGSTRFLVGTGRDHSTRTCRVHSREIGREQSREIGREHSRDMVGRRSPEWLGSRSERGLETTRLKRGKCNRVLFVNAIILVSYVTRNISSSYPTRSRPAGTIHLHNVHACHVL